MSANRIEPAAGGAGSEGSPLDDPFDRTYVQIVVVEVAVLLLLLVFGRMFQ